MIALEQMTEIVTAFLLIAGALFGLIGSFGLLKLRQPMQRLHAPTKTTTVGVGAILLASMLSHWVFHGSPSVQELLIFVFLFVTAPVTALFLAKAHLHETVTRTQVPETGTEKTWSTYSTDDTDEFRP